MIFSTLTLFYLAISFDKSPGSALKYRYFNQIYPIFKNSSSFKEINNNKQNIYTPMYVNAYDLFIKNKLLGVGVGSYLIKSHENFRINKKINGYNTMPNTHPHQFHFEILATLGFPGYLFFLTPISWLNSSSFSIAESQLPLCSDFNFCVSYYFKC